MSQVQLVTVTGDVVQCAVRRPTPRLLAEVAELYAKAEEKFLRSRRTMLLIAEKYPDLGASLAEKQEAGLTALEAMKIASVLDEVTREPLADAAEEYIAIAQRVVVVPDNVQIVWEDQDIEELHKAYVLFRKYVR